MKLIQQKHLYCVLREMALNMLYDVELLDVVRKIPFSIYKVFDNFSSSCSLS